jgi:hypothetical protein
VFVTGQGWVHIDGVRTGGAYWQRCLACGWEGSGVGLSVCPSCGSRRDLIDDHCALPDRSDAGAA